MAAPIFPGMLYGGDYNPEQWLDRPDILAEDIVLLKQSGCNTVTLGMFSWCFIEPEEGVFDFGWLENAIDELYRNGISVILATPSGARPRWLAETYPEVLRVDADGRRNLFGGRHNHCFTSPAYRRRLTIINTELAGRFAAHPAVLLWHISNEYGGECHCDLCRDAFRVWLRERYGDIGEINRQWWTSFWSHTFRDFDDIDIPSARGESAMQGLTLAWKRFVTHQTADFMACEAAPLRAATPHKPVTTNMMYRYGGLNYHKFTDVCDVISWDSYPVWGKQSYAETAADTGFWHDVMRSLKKQPFLLMESCPTATSWQSVSRLKRPGVLKLASLHAVAHGSDAVLYFQIRQSRGASEKLHGALIDHSGTSDTRVFREAAALGEELSTLAEVAGADVRARVAVIYDWENRWAIEESWGPRNRGMGYEDAVLKCYKAFRRLGLDVDVVDMEQELDGYAVAAAPMLYMLRGGVEEKIRRFVDGGGHFILSCWSGVVNENDLCFLGKTPHGLDDVFGLRREELDALYDGEENGIVPVTGNALGLTETYRCVRLCEIVHADGATALMTYAADFYKGTPAFTVHRYGRGAAYYVCADAEQRFWNDAVAAVVRDIPGLDAVPLPDGLELTRRFTDSAEYVFLQNYNEHPVALPALGDGGTVLLGCAEGGSIAALDTILWKM